MDRIDNGTGYVEGNMRLLTASLNKAKGTGKEVPAWAVKWLWRRLERTRFDSLSAKPGSVDQ